MLAQLQGFRDKLSYIMVKCINSTNTIYGYDTYTGRFLNWYAEYYHGIEVSFLVSEDMSTGKGYDKEIFRPSVFDFNYKNIRDSILWIAQPVTEELRKWLLENGYRENENYYDFYNVIYGDDFWVEEDNSLDVFHKVKTGKRDIQFLEWLEFKYGCNFITPISKDSFEVVDSHGARYSCSTQKEIFPMLDRCHFHPSDDDAIFDFGCGKGGAMVTFLDYGFTKVGGWNMSPRHTKLPRRILESLMMIA